MMHQTWVTSYRAALALMRVLLFGWAPHAGGRGIGHGFHGGRGGGSHGGIRGHSGGRFHGHGHHGFRGHHGFKHHDSGLHRHHKFHGKAFIGVAPLFLWAPGVQPPVYVQPRGYWYYCPSAAAYYPYVAACSEPWVPVPAR